MGPQETLQGRRQETKKRRHLPHPADTTAGWPQKTLQERGQETKERRHLPHPAGTTAEWVPQKNNNHVMPHPADTTAGCPLPNIMSHPADTTVGWSLPKHSWPEHGHSSQGLGPQGRTPKKMPGERLHHMRKDMWCHEEYSPILYFMHYEPIWPIGPYWFPWIPNGIPHLHLGGSSSNPEVPVGAPFSKTIFRPHPHQLPPTGPPASETERRE